MAKRKNFTSEQKLAAALAIMKGEKTAVEVGREMGCHPTLVAGWRDALEARGGIVFDKAAEETKKVAHIAKLERAVGRITVENGFLERVLGRSSGA
jgi:transposase-like protein